jgi:glyoxylase-like metal-dependent hydrolase (beta-lactamase superfamily II)
MMTRPWRVALLCLASWAGNGNAWADAPNAANDCRTSQAVPWHSVAPGIWVWLPARGGDLSKRNRGHVIPTSIVVDSGEAMVIDPGPGHQHGRRVRESLRCRFKASVRWVVNTHAHAENVLGNSAFAGDRGSAQLEIVSGAATREAMQQRCPDCLKSLTERVGRQAMAGTRIVLPSRAVVPGDRLSVGRLSLEVLAVEPGHTEGDLVLWHAEQGVLWAGGLVYDQRLPELAQGSLDGWLAALDRLDALPVQQVLGTAWSRAIRPGEQPPAMAATRAYLRDLRRSVLQAMDAGLQAQEAEKLELPAYRHWAGYAERQSFNAQRAWRELEPVWMAQPSGTRALPRSGQDVGR